MTLGTTAYYTLLLGPFLAQVVLLALQVGAYRRHGHASFLILAAGSAFGILVLMLPFTYRWWYGEGMPLSMPWYVSLAAVLMIQVVLAIWGVISLFRSYAELASAARTSPETPNNRWRVP